MSAEEMRHCGGCGEDYNAFGESHAGHTSTPTERGGGDES